MLVAWLGPEPALGDKIKRISMVWLNILCSIAVHVFFLFLGKRGLHRSLLEQVIFVCTNHFVLICVYVCKSAFYLYDNDCLCSPWNIASAKSWFCVYTHVCVHLGILPLQLESRKSLWLWNRLSTIPACGRNLLLKLCSCLLTWTFMSCQKTNSVRTTSFMKLVSSGYQTHLGHGGVDDND